MTRLIYILLALILPLGVAVWAIHLPQLTRPWFLLIPVAIVVSLAVLPLARYIRGIPALEDGHLSVFLATIYLIIPSGALVLLLNRAGAFAPRTERLEVVDRFPDQADGAPDAWVFLWTGQDIQRIRVAPGEALYLCQPLDTVSLHYATGLLGLEYLGHVDPH